MNFRIGFFGVILALAMISVTFAAEGEKIAVLELLNHADISDSEANYLTDRVRGVTTRSLSSVGYSVMTKENIYELLPPDTDLKKCTQAECEVQIGRQLGAAYIITGTLLQFEGEYRAMLKVHHSQSGAFVAEQSVAGKNLKELESKLQNGAATIASQIKRHGRAGVAQGEISETPRAWNFVATEMEVIKFESVPSGAVVMADGRLLCQSTPCSRELPIGPVTITMDKEKFILKEEVINIEKGQPGLNWTLKPNYGLLNINSNPAGLSVRINKNQVGYTPLQGHILDPGEYEILIDDPRYYSKGEVRAIRAGDSLNLTYTLVPKEGVVMVKSYDQINNALKADVFVDGTKMGKTFTSLKILVGKHKLEVKAPNQYWSGNIDVQEGVTSEVIAKLNYAASSRPAKPAAKAGKKKAAKAKMNDKNTFFVGLSAGSIPAQLQFEMDDGDSEISLEPGYGARFEVGWMYNVFYWAIFGAYYSNAATVKYFSYESDWDFTYGRVGFEMGGKWKVSKSWSIAWPVGIAYDLLAFKYAEDDLPDEVEAPEIKGAGFDFLTGLQGHAMFAKNHSIWMGLGTGYVYSSKMEETVYETEIGDLRFVPVMIDLGYRFYF